MRYLHNQFSVLVAASCLLLVNSVQLHNGLKKLDDSDSVSCVSVTFINAYKKPIRLWKTMSRTSFKGFAVLGKRYRLKTMVTDPHKPVVYHAEPLNAADTNQLLLDGQESISILPFDCDDKFIKVTITAAAHGKACLVSQGGNAGGQCCHFPFVYKGVSHATCINTDREALWCATTPQFDNGGFWGYCK